MVDRDGGPEGEPGHGQAYCHAPNHSNAPNHSSTAEQDGEACIRGLVRASSGVGGGERGEREREKFIDNQIDD